MWTKHAIELAVRVCESRQMSEVGRGMDPIRVPVSIDNQQPLPTTTSYNKLHLNRLAWFSMANFTNALKSEASNVDKFSVRGTRPVPPLPEMERSRLVPTRGSRTKGRQPETCQEPHRCGQQRMHETDTEPGHVHGRRTQLVKLTSMESSFFVDRKATKLRR